MSRAHPGSTACLAIHGEHNPKHPVSPHRCRCVIHGEHQYHECRCGTTWLVWAAEYTCKGCGRALPCRHCEKGEP